MAYRPKIVVIKGTVTLRVNEVTRNPSNDGTPMVRWRAEIVKPDTIKLDNGQEVNVVGRTLYRYWLDWSKKPATPNYDNIVAQNYNWVSALGAPADVLAAETREEFWPKALDWLAKANGWSFTATVDTEFDYLKEPLAPEAIAVGAKPKPMLDAQGNKITIGNGQLVIKEFLGAAVIPNKGG